MCVEIWSPDCRRAQTWQITFTKKAGGQCTLKCVRKAQNKDHGFDSVNSYWPWWTQLGVHAATTTCLLQSFIVLLAGYAIVTSQHHFFW